MFIVLNVVKEDIQLMIVEIERKDKDQDTKETLEVILIIVRIIIKDRIIRREGLLV